ncbi:hypothetical protein EYC84_006627 [Monilinia fructicola]|uniref:Uncharacterized protein n=1 Tax=Monilinia fructicola TaxID=38448 RepID=A0A5M9K6P2_MONFR|nr:hypothetical protein EYC84_006627 [Monilinia fructicola]
MFFTHNVQDGNTRTIHTTPILKIYTRSSHLHEPYAKLWVRFVSPRSGFNARLDAHTVINVPGVLRLDPSPVRCQKKYQTFNHRRRRIIPLLNLSFRDAWGVMRIDLHIVSPSLFQTGSNGIKHGQCSFRKSGKASQYHFRQPWMMYHYL